MNHPECENCLKTPELCICESLNPLQTGTEVLILQHPQEPDKVLGSAKIAQLSLSNSNLKIGLSWPNLKAALGKEAVPSQWGVLYLGSGIKSAGPEPLALPKKEPALVWVNKKGEAQSAVSAGKQIPLAKPVSPGNLIQGLIVLDGTWSQAKALWWRNAWLLKLKRLVLVPSEKSLYGELRREPRRECLSTIESIAASLRALGESQAVSEELKKRFSLLLEKQRARLNRKPVRIKLQ